MEYRAMAEQTKIRMSATEFRQLPETNRFQELINGELIVSPSPMSEHQDLVFNIAVLLRQTAPNGKVVIAPMDVYFDEGNALQPDVFWMTKDSQCVNREGYYYGPPELVVEVHSPATATRDKREKFAIYQNSGVHEYWMIDPIANHIEVWQRQGEQFQRLGIYKEGDSFESTAMDIKITVKGIFPDSP